MKYRQEISNATGGLGLKTTNPKSAINLLDMGSKLLN